ncbi:hypothetical protein L21SP2_2199 [Salinispira pacifica]|uniref:TIGR02757 family protein n=1 Tax=Salinispira pacifica TaxID=1307761 RepID=V5WIC2_9SPIO|nr:hypothetical protein L21SP2_2199 [Salinispira pacifica]
MPRALKIISPSAAAVFRKKLDALYDQLNQSRFIHPDPLEAALKFPEAGDREIAAFLSAMFALGRVDLILQTLDTLFTHLPNPRKMLLELDPDNIPRQLMGIIPPMKYRFFSYARILLLISSMAVVIQKFGSLQQAAAPVPGESEEAVYPGLAAAMNLRYALERGAEDQIRRFPELFQGEDGIPGIIVPEVKPPFHRSGAAKRMMLFLRWMVRRDEVDPGGWNILSPADLLYPLDTHMMRVTAELGLRSRKSADMSTVIEITDNFRIINSEDPVKYDFALTRTGIHPETRSLHRAESFWKDIIS